MRNLRNLLLLVLIIAVAFVIAPSFAGPYDIAVIIGNRNYGSGIPNVDFAHRDAAAFRRYAVDILKVRERNILDLRDATQSQLYKTFGAPGGLRSELFFLVRPNRSEVFVYYSGHGVPGLADKRGYLLPVDGDPDLVTATGYPIDGLYEHLRSLPIPRATVFLDACFSGDSFDGPLFKTASPFGIKIQPPSKKDDRVLVLTAASGTELASWHVKHRHGLFTDYLLEGLYGAADIDQYGKRDGRVTLKEMRGYLGEEMSYYARRELYRIQTPTVHGPDDHVFAVYGSGSYPRRPSVDDEVGPVPRAGTVFRDCPDCPEMVWLPRGSFIMGSPSGEAGRGSDEGPVPYRVKIDYDLALGTKEVTVGEFRAFVNATGHDAGRRCYMYENGSWDWRDGKNWQNPGFSQTDQSPVVCVNWADARAYTQWLGRTTGESYRLPTEAEWEYGTRGGTQSRYWWGSSIGHDQANYGTDSCCGPLSKGQDRWDYTSPVGSFSANGYKLHDVHGNVWEWVADCYKSKSYANHSNYPRMTGTWHDSCARVIRGGSWYGHPGRLRAADRYRYTAVNRDFNLGFRVARGVGPARTD